MQPYAWEFDDRYDTGFGRARGGGRRYAERPPSSYDRGYARGWRPAPYGYSYGRDAYTGYDVYRGYAPSKREGRELRGRYGGGYGGEYRVGPMRPGSMTTISGRADAGLGGDVDSVRAAELMTRSPEAVTPDTPILEVARRMRDLDVGVMPVVDDADSFRLQGIVTDRDIAIRAAAEGKDVKKTAVREIMSSRPQTVGESDHIRDVFTVMKRARVRRVPVTDVDGRLVGIVAQADLAVNYAGLDLQRETEVEEVIERISEPARPRWGREGATEDDRGRMQRRFRPDLEIDLPDRVRAGWRTLRREARELMGRGYDRGWR